MSDVPPWWGPLDESKGILIAGGVLVIVAAFLMFGGEWIAGAVVLVAGLAALVAAILLILSRAAV